MTTELTAEEKTVQLDDNTGRAVRIVWTDSGLAHHYGWMKFDETTAGSGSKVMDVETVGIWMGENDKVVLVAHSHDANNENWNASMTIFKPCIVTLEWLS